ncbi:hypothetical protein L1887_04708 [Cichorium endivia]|nr:hypothetical protein L1887_04708 [Cichorium endivia]
MLTFKKSSKKVKSPGNVPNLNLWAAPTTLKIIIDVIICTGIRVLCLKTPRINLPNQTEHLWLRLIDIFHGFCSDNSKN